VKIVFLCFLALHVVHSIAAGRQKRRAALAGDAGTTRDSETSAAGTETAPEGGEPLGDKPQRVSPLATLIHGPLFIMACYYGFQHDVWSRQLISPVYIALGLVLGHAIFAFSLTFIHHSLREGWEILVDVRDLWRFTFDAPAVLSRFISVAVGEEVIWRVAAQPILSGLLESAALGIVLVAILFSLCHDHFFNNTFMVGAEFVVFALILGGMYYVTSSLILVILVHALRDIEIAYLEFCAKVAEYGDRERASAFIDQSYAMAKMQRS